MATQNDATSARPAPRASTSSGKLVEYDQFIEDQLRKTRSQVRAVDVAGSLMTLVAGAIVFFLAAAVVDHWVVSGGLGFWGRLTLFAVFLAAMIAYLATQVLPLVVRRINPLYAAQTIERSRPTLKNALLNFLFLRANPGGLPGVVYQAVEEQAATHLAKVQVETAVDRTKLVRTGYALVGIVLVAAVYMLVSPKNLLLSAGRIVLPWADIGAPTRTAIVDVTPGDVQAFRGQQITVSARIQGLPSDGKVVLRYTTADGQVVERPLEMSLGSDGYKHTCTLPPGQSALQQSLEYRIEAGDAVTKQYQVQVAAAPTIVVRSVAYHYPTYTGLIDQRVEQQGDIRAIEGTEVTLEALANQEIQSAHVDFDCDAKNDQPMRFEGSEAKVTFRLGLKDDHRPDHSSYQLIFKNAAGQQNPQPVRHQIEVTRDLPPEVQIVAPKRDDLELPLDAATQIEVVAIDPDFALSAVKLSASVGNKPMTDQVLLDKVRSGQFVRKFRFEPRKLALKVGDVVEYWAVAEDNKQPRPNHTETAKRRLRIVSPDAKRSNQDRLARNDQRGDVERQEADPGKGSGDDEHPRTGNAPPDQKPERGDQSKPQPREDTPQSNSDQQQADGQKQDDQQQPGGQEGDKSHGEGSGGKPQATKRGPSGEQQGRDENIASDGSNDADAIERILKHQEEQQKSKPSSGDQSKARPDGQQKASQQEQEQEQATGQNSGGQAQDRQQADSQGDHQNQKAVGRQGSGEDRQQAKDRGQEPSDRTDQKQSGEEGSGDKAQQGADAQDDQRDKSSEQKSKQSPSERGKADRSQDQKGQKGPKGQQGSGDGGQTGKDGSAGDQPQGSKGKQNTRDQRSQGSPSAQEKGDESPQGDDASDSSQSKPSTEPGRGKSSDSRGADRSETQDATDGQRDAAQPEKGQPSKGQPGQKQPGKDDAASSDQRDGDKAGQQPDKRDHGAADRGKQRADERDSGRPGQKPDDHQPTTDDGAQAKPDPTSAKDQKPSGDQSKPDAKGGDSERNKGNSGAGQATKDAKGSPSPTTEAKPIEKPSRTSQDDQNKSEDQAHSAADDRRESDSEGQDSGDRSGGGKRGGGQKANKSGTGGPGQNTAADEGAGRSDQSGEGETADRPGDRRQSESPQGKPGSQKGKGSQSRSGAGDKAGGNDAPKDAASPSDRSGSPTGQPGQGGTQSSGPPQGGKPGGAPVDQKWQPTEDQADEANLEYARKATDLALAHLKDELKKERPDPQLLKRLGWTPKDLENFVKRWEQMRGQARQPGEKGAAAQKELDDTLKSLGLRPKSTSLKHSTARDDQSRGLKESRRTTPPPEYAEQSKAYSQGTARGEK